MITFVSGQLVDKKPTHAIVDVGGMGYEVLIPASSYDKLPALGKAVRLLTDYQVREDAATLYGFASDAERQLFRTMISVTGVGPKLALAALSAMSPSELREAVVNEDTGMLVRIPGVGKRKAERLIVELRDKFAALDGVALSGPADSESTAARADARAGLEALGLSRAEAEKRLRKVLRAHPGLQSADVLIRHALRES